MSSDQAFETSVEEILSGLGLLPTREVLVADAHVRYALSAPGVADYVVCVDVYDQSQINIAAMKKPLENNDYLWEGSFEVNENREIPFLIESFHNMLTTILTHETRVVIERGRFSTSNDMEYYQEGTWHSLYPCGSVHLQFWKRVPTSERKRTYTSPAYI